MQVVILALLKLSCKYRTLYLYLSLLHNILNLNVIIIFTNNEALTSKSANKDAFKG